MLAYVIGTLNWSKKICVSSSDIHRRTVTYDSTTSQLYFASDMANNYVFICRINKDTGAKIYCAKYDGDGADYPVFLSVVGDFLLILGSSDSSELNGGSTYGNHLSKVLKTLQSDYGCTTLDLQEDPGISIVDEAITITPLVLADFTITAITPVAPGTVTLGSVTVGTF